MTLKEIVRNEAGGGSTAELCSASGAGAAKNRARAIFVEPPPSCSDSYYSLNLKRLYNLSRHSEGILLEPRYSLIA